MNFIITLLTFIKWFIKTQRINIYFFIVVVQVIIVKNSDIVNTFINTIRSFCIRPIKYSKPEKTITL